MAKHFVNEASHVAATMHLDDLDFHVFLLLFLFFADTIFHLVAYQEEVYELVVRELQALSVMGKAHFLHEKICVVFHVLYIDFSH